MISFLNRKEASDVQLELQVQERVYRVLGIEQSHIFRRILIGSKLSSGGKMKQEFSLEDLAFK